MSARPTFTSLSEDAQAEAKPAPTASQGSFMLSLSDQPAVTAKSRTKVNSFNVILGAMVLGSAFLIVGMRKFGLSSAAASAEFKIDYARADEDPQRVARQDRAIARLDAEQGAVATPITSKSVAVSPFFEPQRKEESRIGVSNPDDLSMRQKLEAQRKLEDRMNARKTAFAKLKLESIIKGAKPVARISKETVAVGDTVGEIFHVTAITDRAVELMCDDEKFVLELNGKINVKDGKKPSKPGPQH